MIMTPKFEIVDIFADENEKPNIKVVIVDDARFIGYIFHFNSIELDYESDGIGVSYDLNIDIHKDYLPTDISEEQTANIKKIAQNILEKIMSDFVEMHNSGALDNPVDIV